MSSPLDLGCARPHRAGLFFMDLGLDTARQALRSLPPARRLLAVVTAVFVVFHLTTTLVRGAPPSLRDAVWPLFRWYGDGLRMATTYGMFARRSSDIAALVIAVEHDGTRRLLSHSNQTERGSLRRIVDVRLRKIQRHLIETPQRQSFGREYLQYFCREALARGEAPKKVELELLHPATERAPERREVALSVRCAGAR